MYLYEDQMEIALKEALRIVKPGGHICLTNFVEHGGWIGSILEPIKKVQWSKWSNEYSLKNMVIKTQLYQDDRYYVCFEKS